MDINSLFEKNVSEFSEKTPKGNLIAGKILLNHGFYHGSLLIESVNGKPTKQFVRGFPKIKYYDEENMDINYPITAYEKLDGTCVGIYALRDVNDNIIEYVPKSRQKAILDNHFCEMLQLCDTRLIEQNIELLDVDVVYMEMFGMLNEHTLPHKKINIDLRLIGAVKDNKMIPPFKLQTLSNILKIPLPKKIVSIIQSVFVEGYYVYFGESIFSELDYDQTVGSFAEAIQVIKKYLDKCNEIYKNEKGYLKYEGVVFQNTTSYDDILTTQYIKLKPDTFLEFADIDKQLTVSINEIRKEISKIINENLTEYNESYNEKEVIAFINENLREEYSKDDVKNKRVQNVIIKELHKYIDHFTDNNINKMVEDIMKNNPDKPVGDMMRYFAEEYPMLKHRSGDIYFILNKRIKKGDMK